jgi:hypothetical protein
MISDFMRGHLHCLHGKKTDGRDVVIELDHS